MALRRGLVLRHGARLQARRLRPRDAAARPAPLAAQKRFELAALSIAAVAVAYLAWWANRFTYESWAFNDIAQGMLPLPLWIPQLSFALGSILLLVAVLDELVIVLRGGRPSYVVAVEERHAKGDFSADV